MTYPMHTRAHTHAQKRKLDTHAARSCARTTHTGTPETANRRDYIEKLKTRIVDEASKIQVLRKNTAANSLQGKLNKCVFVVGL